MKADVSAAKQQALAITPNEYNVILVVEGYDILLNKIKAYEQRLFKNQVLQGLNVEEQRRRRKDDTEMSKYPSSSEIEHLVNKAQIDLKANIFMVRAKQESIMWLNSFTHMIGQSLYDKFERNQDWQISEMLNREQIPNQLFAINETIQFDDSSKSRYFVCTASVSTSDVHQASISWNIGQR